MKIRYSTLIILSAVLLAPVALAGRMPQRSNPDQQQPPVTPVTPAVPAVPQQNRLSPADDWVAALRAGGTVLFGPGEFITDQQVEVFSDLEVHGAGIDQTFLHFDSDGGEFGEQFAIVGEAGQPVRVTLNDLSVLHGGSYRSDLITVWGQAHLEANRLGVGAATDVFVFTDEYDGGAWYGSGVVIVDGATAGIYGSYFYLNNQGIATFNAGSVTVADTAFVENWLAGIYVEDTPITVSGSRFELNDIGIELYGTHPRQFTDNSFVDQGFQDILETE